jgi:serine/threonine protein kinase
VTMGTHALRSLDQLHGSGLVVRDIKPENILLDSHGEAVLSDFGISAVLGTRSIVESSIKGTFNYMAPEAFELGPIDSPRDIWSMACVVVEMFTGNTPWKDMQMQQIMRTVCDHRRVPDVPDAAPAANMLRRCFEFEKARRPTAGQMVSSTVRQR